MTGKLNVLTNVSPTLAGWWLNFVSVLVNLRSAVAWLAMGLHGLLRQEKKILVYIYFYTSHLNQQPFKHLITRLHFSHSVASVWYVQIVLISLHSDLMVSVNVQSLVCFLYTILITHCAEKLNSNGDKTSRFFRPFSEQKPELLHFGYDNFDYRSFLLMK